MTVTEIALLCVDPRFTETDDTPLCKSLGKLGSFL